LGISLLLLRRLLLPLLLLLLLLRPCVCPYLAGCRPSGASRDGAGVCFGFRWSNAVCAGGAVIAAAAAAAAAAE